MKPNKCILYLAIVLLFLYLRCGLPSSLSSEKAKQNPCERQDMPPLGVIDSTLFFFKNWNDSLYQDCCFKELVILIENEKYEEVEKFLRNNKGGDCVNGHNVAGINALFYIHYRPGYLSLDTQDLKMARLLLENGVDPDMIDVGGENMLFHIGAIENANATKLFLDYGANPCVINSNGETVMDFLLESILRFAFAPQYSAPSNCNYFKVLKHLHDYGGCFHKFNGYGDDTLTLEETIIAIAMEHGNEAFAQYITNYGLECPEFKGKN